MARGLRVTLLLNSSSEIWVPTTISFHSVFLKHVPQKPTVLRTTKQKVIQSGLVKKRYRLKSTFLSKRLTIFETIKTNTRR